MRARGDPVGRRLGKELYRRSAGTDARGMVEALEVAVGAAQDGRAIVTLEAERSVVGRMAHGSCPCCHGDRT
jgi:hypothetical protein